MTDWLVTALTESPPADLLRLLAVPVFGWAALRDVRTRRVPNLTWLPLALLGIALLAWESWRVSTGSVVGGDVARERFFLRVALSLGLVGSLGYVFYWMGGFGGADAKALVVLAVLFPTFPEYLFPGSAFPMTRTTVGVFSLTILSNTVLVGALYPVYVAVRNAVRGRVAPVMLFGTTVRVDDVTERHGSLLETPDGFTRRGLDLDALRMYLRWRGRTLADLRSDPDRYRDPASLPDDPSPPGDGAVASGGEPVDADPDAVTDGGARGDSAATETQSVDDPWGSAAFLDDVEGSAYGTTPEDLRDGLDLLVEADVVWLSPGIPFVVPMFVGLLISLVYGDLFVEFVSLLV